MRHVRMITQRYVLARRLYVVRSHCVKDSFGKTGFSITCEIGTLLAHVTAEKDGFAYEQ